MHTQHQYCISMCYWASGVPRPAPCREHLSMYHSMVISSTSAAGQGRGRAGSWHRSKDNRTTIYTTCARTARCTRSALVRATHRAARRRHAPAARARVSYAHVRHIYMLCLRRAQWAGAVRPLTHAHAPRARVRARSARCVERGAARRVVSAADHQHIYVLVFDHFPCPVLVWPCHCPLPAVLMMLYEHHS